ncbi:AraC family transcriptional regulator [Pedobacter lithocola]|uniref:AraC family transcriptional regulator n=1 Tax=Pedobacter lithocola TaxID=1908239 RepID=A0ABV8PBM0_9SPHI
MVKSHLVFIEENIKDSFFIAGVNNIQPGYNRLSYHRMILVNEGTGHIQIDGHKYQINNHNLFLLSKGQFYSFDPSSDVDGYVLSFGDCFWEKTPASASNCKAVLFNNAQANQLLKLNAEDAAELNYLFGQLIKEFKRKDYINKIDALAAYLKIIIIKTANIYTPQRSDVGSQDYLTYRKFLELLSSFYKSRHEVSDYAEMLGMTSRRLSDLTKRCSGKNAKDLINGQLVAEGKRSLQFSANSVKEIAYDLSFSTPEQFSHFFKKNTDYSPLDYRNYFLSIGN